MQAHEQEVHDRAALIRSLASKHNVKGYDHSPVAEDQAIEFEHKLKDIHQRMASGYEKLAATGVAKTDTLSKGHLKLASQHTQYKVERDNIWQNIVCSYAIS
jgi:DNA repair protein RAD50